jgi:hypothetical protein
MTNSRDYVETSNIPFGAARAVMRWILAAFFVTAGVAHLAVPDTLLSITPNWVPFAPQGRPPWGFSFSGLSAVRLRTRFGRGEPDEALTPRQSVFLQAAEDGTHRGLVDCSAARFLDPFANNLCTRPLATDLFQLLEREISETRHSGFKLSKFRHFYFGDRQPILFIFPRGRDDFCNQCPALVSKKDLSPRGIFGVYLNGNEPQ